MMVGGAGNKAVLEAGNYSSSSPCVRSGEGWPPDIPGLEGSESSRLALLRSYLGVQLLGPNWACVWLPQAFRMKWRGARSSTQM